MGKVVTSHFNRAYQTAKLAGFDNVEKSADVTEGGLVVSPNENNRRAAAFRKLASTPPPAGTNILVVTHKPNTVDAFGKDWFEVKEGEATISSRMGRLQGRGACADGRMAPHRRGREEMNWRRKSVKP